MKYLFVVFVIACWEAGRWTGRKLTQKKTAPLEKEKRAQEAPATLSMRERIQRLGVVRGRDNLRGEAGSEAIGEMLKELLLAARSHAYFCPGETLGLSQAIEEAESALLKHSSRNNSRPTDHTSQTSSRKTVIQPNTRHVLAETDGTAELVHERQKGISTLELVTTAFED